MRSMHGKWLTRSLLTAVLVGLVVAMPGTAGKANADVACPWMDLTKTPDQRAQALLAASTLDQKLRWLDEQAANNPTQTTFQGGVTYPVQVPCTPIIQYSDGPAGIAGAGTGVTAFPSQTALAATWDAALSRKKGKAQGYEAFHKHRNVLLGPGLGNARVPFAGRTSEYLGEDSLLGGILAGATIRGLRDNPDAPVESVLKHWVANEQELDRQTSSSNLDARTLHEIYAMPYEIAIASGNPGGIMCSYNQVNGVYACENPATLNGVLKSDIGFGGWVVTDFGAVESLNSNPPSLAAGLDQELNRPRNLSPANLHAALDAGRITLAQIDGAAFRVVRAHIANGLFDHPLPAAAEADVSTPENQAVARQEVEEGSVLLKNSGVLPIGNAVRSIAVIGPTASNTPTNGISAVTACGATAPSVPCTPKAPLDSIATRAALTGTTVTFDNGSDLAAAAATAAAADVAVVFGYYREGEFNDRNLSLDNNGDALIAAIAAANPNTVVVLETGGPVLMPWLDNVKSVLEVWSPGQEMGPAIASLLWGDVNPSGKLPLTFPKSAADIPTAGSPAQYPGIFNSTGTSTPPNPRNGEIRQVNYTEGLNVGYRWYDSQGIAPLFAFGHGLSYTTFKYSKLKVQATENGYLVKFKVKNTGERAGDEVSQVYVGAPHDPPAGLSFSPKVLGGFARTELDPGELKDITVHVPYRSVQYWSVQTGKWEPALGVHTISVGSSSDDLELDADITVLPAALGSREVGSNPDGNEAGRAVTFRALATTTGSVSQLFVYLNKKTSSKLVIGGIYADADGHPGALLASGQISSPRKGDWNRIALPSTTLKDGKSYWFAFIGKGGELVLQDECCGAAGFQPNETSPGHVDALPATWETGNVFPNDGPVSAYAPIEAQAAG